MILSIVLGGCAYFLPGTPVGPVSPGEMYQGGDAATVNVITEQVGCCYIEGSLRFARLDGPTTIEWAVDDGSGSGVVGEIYHVGHQAITVEPGDYTLTEWEEVCDGNCGMLDGATNHCTLDFSAEVGATLEIAVSFPLGKPCVATVQ